MLKILKLNLSVFQGWSKYLSSSIKYFILDSDKLKCLVVLLMLFGFTVQGASGPTGGLQGDE